MRRRTFLKVATIGGMAALNFLYPGITNILSAAKTSVLAAPNTGMKPQWDPTFDPDFAGGRIVEMIANGVILESGDELRAVRITPDTQIWKEDFFSAKKIKLQIGDHMDVRGIGLEDGSVEAQRAWINIGRLDGIVEQVSPSGLVLKNRHGYSRAIEVSSKLEVVRAKAGTPLPNHLLSLVPGNSIGSVGLRLPNGGFRATKIWLWEAVQ